MNIFKNFFILIVLLSIIGCSNHQNSTRSQAEAVVAAQENFEDFVQYIAISAKGIIGHSQDPVIKNGYPAIKPSSLIHQIFYLNKDGLLCCAFLNDTPRIVLTVPRTAITK